ncbi:MAG: 23S rRNA (uracil(1939)-C(5))-methyltransferase RlmD [Candidatus Omnitrophica bacterium]|nr:23S rRNA (uracil(1939)-C(5))-methyltransferase RlmD [Candidatus Omnitrophota bacterium]
MICKHFGICGGCKFQDIPYPEQLALKENKIIELIERYDIKTKVNPINYFPQWFYRNKMEFTFFSDGSLICGLHCKDNKRKVFNLEECLIFSQDTSKIVKRVSDFCRNYGYLPYNTFTHKGFLRHLLVRETKFTSQLMIGIVTTTKTELPREEFVNSMLSLDLSKKINSIYWILNDSWGDAVIFQEKRLLYGLPFITEKMDKFDFRIYIDSFFQINPFGMVELCKKVRDSFSLTADFKILDLYCGCGTIGIFLAEKAKFIWGVEVNSSAIENAFINANINGIKNISFIHSDVTKFLKAGNLKEKIDMIVINPPRCGLSQKIREKILFLNADFIFYSSCNPKTFFSDLKYFSSPYTLLFIEPFDFFPHTPHLEVVGFLRKND